MNPATLRIDGRNITVPAGRLLIEAAGQAGIFIPSLCRREGYKHYTSCLLCAVEDKKSGKLVPACSVQAESGMEIETDNSRVNAARKDTLELLLSEHTGDCLAPCQRTCPVHYAIPGLLARLQAGQYAAARDIILEDLPFPAITGSICPAPCEKACRRNKHDAAVSICALEKITGAFALANPGPPPLSPTNNKTVAIVGAGPAGLAAAWRLLRYGYPVTVYDKQAQPGGALRTALPAGRLDPSLLDAEIEARLAPHVTFRMNTAIGSDIPLDKLRNAYAAVILTTGALDPKLSDTIPGPGFATALPGVFAGSTAVKPLKMAVLAMAHGKELAAAVHSYLSGQAETAAKIPFLSTITKITQVEWEALVQLANPEPAAPLVSDNNVAGQAARCLHCECSKLDACALRSYSLVYNAQAGAHKYGTTSRALLERRVSPGGIVFEPGKCIKCGLCVRITAPEQKGMTFLKRGYEITVDTPFAIPLDSGLGAYAALCITACPTGALSRKNQKEDEHENL